MKLRVAIAVVATCGVLAASFTLGRNVDPFGVAAAPAEPLEIAQSKITADSYRKAFDAYVQCAVDSGMVTVGEVHTSRFGRLSLELTSPGATGAEGVASFHTAHEACRQQHLNEAELAWVLAHPPSPEEADEARQLTAGCLARTGMDLPAAVDRSALSAAIARGLASDDADTRRSVGACLEATADAMNWPGYGGS